MAFAVIISLLLVFPVFTSALPKRDTSKAAWDALNKTVNGQLYTAIPFARPCFQSSSLAGTFDEAACQSVQANYLNATVRSNTFATYMASQSETCSATGAQCYLDWQNVTNPAAVSSSETCSQGSVSTHYIDVKKASDVQAAFQFSSRTGVPLVIKNTGHDYAGRSSLVNSLGLWSHNLKSRTFNAKFTPQGCPAKTFPAATIGAGVQTAELYEYADQQGITLPGGACVSVGIAGGYLQGGGHSWLSNIYGLAVDRVLEFEVVTPTGQHLFANACQNTDLYFALRGGGGGHIWFRPLGYHEGFTESILYFWSTDGWSGQIRPGAKLVLTAVNTTEAAATTYFSDLQGVAQSIGGAFSVVTTPSYLAFHNKFIVPDALNELDDSLVNIVTNSQVSFIFANAPFSFKQDASLGPASVNPAWRNSLWHVVAGAGWTFDTPASVQSIIYDSLTSGIDTLRNITPSSGAYLNEADLHEPNYSESFWGSNYDQLVQIKKKYDPQHLLDCWHCVGWKGAADASFSCYL
ncbi:FAD-binding domain-containing protein [Mycena olivaceomarginata]|nr:FAD-binding domain-containing protein [Mycena olivaceomarginata]